MWIRNRYKPEEKYQVVGHETLFGELYFLVFKKELDNWFSVPASMFIPVEEEKEEEQTLDI